MVEQEKLSPQDREASLAADNYQGAHVQAPIPKPGRFEELKHLARMFGFPW